MRGLLIIGLLCGLLVSVAYAAQQTFDLVAGDTLTVHGETDLTMRQLDSKTVEVAAAASQAGVPDCTDHNPSAWHAVVKRDANGGVLCSYGHEHKDNPKVLDGLFGALPYGEISYPWETHQENANKHRVYGWATLDGQGKCMADNSRLGISAARFQAHMDGNGGATVRFHSYFMQAQTCDLDDPGNLGTMQVGGHMDYGTLHVRTTQSEDGMHVPLAGDPSFHLSARRVHGSTGIPEAKDRLDMTWYGMSVHPDNKVSGEVYVSTEVGLRAEDWGPIDPNDPATVHFYGPPNNGSWQEPLHVLSFRIPTGLAGPDGRVNYTGWTDRHGRIVTAGCTTAGPDCVPLVLKNVKPGYYQFRSAQHGFGVREYDVMGPDGKSLTEYPN